MPEPPAAAVRGPVEETLGAELKATSDMTVGGEGGHSAEGAETVPLTGLARAARRRLISTVLVAVGMVVVLIALVSLL